MNPQLQGIAKVETHTLAGTPLHSLHVVVHGHSLKLFDEPLECSKVSFIIVLAVYYLPPMLSSRGVDVYEKLIVSVVGGLV